ncbi:MULTISPECIES: hypothetical protein [Bacillus cereus group]|uniref:Uncharacterized protein n=2 Tax=Bacillus cereus TaxID=1396 RepID=A0A9W7QEU3_BACCE|nr:hypothetical protein [Bacillus cereus]KAB2394940.1 hypothetical protein F8172_16000 [Bacillus cereus]KAB2410238.1 hypothetical protein F8170_03680 [Bacillus cereus]KAB2428699.1 hypothetical protein F8168_17070 [Bacillus cereus]
MENKIRLGSIIQIFSVDKIIGLYIVSKLSIDHLIQDKYALIGTNGQHFLNMNFNNLQDLELQLELEDSWRVLNINAEKLFLEKDSEEQLKKIIIQSKHNVIIDKWNIEKEFSSIYKLEDVIRNFIHSLSRRYGFLKNIKIKKDKNIPFYYAGDLFLDIGIILKIKIELINDEKKQTQTWICNAKLIS